MRVLKLYLFVQQNVGIVINESIRLTHSTNAFFLVSFSCFADCFMETLVVTHLVKNVYIRSETPLCDVAPDL